MQLPDTIERITRSARIPLRTGAMFAFTGVGASAFLSEERWRSMPDDRRDAYVMWWSSWVLGTLGVEVVEDPASARLGPVPEGGRMIVSNHRSMLDILVLLARFGGHMLSRDDLGKWPVIGWLAGFAQTLYVDRSSPTSGAASIRQVSDKLMARRTVTVFAEGTTFPDDEVRPFQPGAFVAITRAGGEVVPLGIAYDGAHAIFFQERFGVHARRVLEAPRTRVAVSVGEPIAVERRTSKALSALTHARVQELVYRARGLL
jgi:1-acyl-sn-glycerol-3-phosphate acyltransferase